MDRKTAMNPDDRKELLMQQLGKALERVKQNRNSNVTNIQPEKEYPPAQSAPQTATPVSPFPLHTHTPAPPPAMAELADVDETHLERHRILAQRARSPEADIFRILRTQILQIMNRSSFRTLAITSPNYGDGKTTIALNLALSIALDLKQTVLLADLDLRKPNLHEYMGFDPRIGLSNYLLQNRPLSECLIRPAFDRLNTLPAGPPIDYSSEILGSPKMAALANELKSRYPDRMIIYDMPPVLAQDDSIAFMPHVDAVLMVVRDGITRTDEVKQCLERLANANVVGVVLNDARDAPTIRAPIRRKVA